MPGSPSQTLIKAEESPGDLVKLQIPFYTLEVESETLCSNKFLHHYPLFKFQLFLSGHMYFYFCSSAAVYMLRSKRDPRSTQVSTVEVGISSKG